MTVVRSDAIVLKSVKYGDSSLIVTCYTKEHGLKSFLVKGVYGKKKTLFKPSFFQLLTQIQFSVNYKSDSSLNFMKNVQILQHYSNISQSVVKQCIVLFTAEVLVNSIKEEETNINLFEYIQFALLWLDTNDKTANFHLYFMLNLTKYLGFYPDMSNSNWNNFNLIEGEFTDNINAKNIVSGEVVEVLKLFLNVNFDKLSTIPLNNRQRQLFLKFLIQYFELHLDGFKSPNSLEVLENIFT